MTKALKILPRCADCTIETTICRNADGKGPVYCPTLKMTDVVAASLKEYNAPEIQRFAVNATIQEGECYVNRDKDNPHARYAVKPRGSRRPLSLPTRWATRDSVWHFAAV